MNFEKVLNGILKYMDKEIYSGMNDWQELAARIAVSRMLKNSKNIKSAICDNTFVRTFAIVDENGNIDIDGLYSDIKEQINSKGKIEITLPLFGTFKFSLSDVDNLYSTITG